VGFEHLSSKMFLDRTAGDLSVCPTESPVVTLSGPQLLGKSNFRVPKGTRKGGFLNLRHQVQQNVCKAVYVQATPALNRAFLSLARRWAGGSFTGRRY